MAKTNSMQTKLAAENGEIYLLQWLCSLEKSLAGLATVRRLCQPHHVAHSPQDTLKSVQPSTEANLIKCISAAPPFPVPGRPIRALVARCFLALYARGETRTLYDTVQACLKIAGDTKPTERDTRL